MENPGARHRPEPRERTEILVLATKLHIPRTRMSLVPRPRLITELARAMQAHQKLVLISSPPGFGKTTLLSEWCATHKHRTAWLALDESDNEPTRFWNYLIAALQTVRAGAGGSALALLRAQPLRQTRERDASGSMESFLTVLLNELATLQDKLILVLDDYHVITNPALHEGMTFLIDHLPAQMQLILTTRADPPLPLARWRARDQTTEIRADDLRFTSDEAATFLNQAMGLQLTRDDIASLEARTEGWVVGLHLAALSLQGRDEQGQHNFVVGFSGSQRFVLDYLADQVLERQPSDIQTFLLETSLLDRFNGPSCDAVTGHGESARILEYLEQANLFLIPLDESRVWYRYHQLFADMLRHRLRETRTPEQVNALHRRASEWDRDNGFVEQAIEHALAAHDYERAAGLMEEAAPARMRAVVTPLLQWLERIPDELIASHPQLCLAHAWTLANMGRFQEAEARLTQAEASFDPQDQILARTILGESALVRASMAMLLDDTPRTIEYGEKALELLPPEQTNALGLTRINLAIAYTWLGNQAAAYRLLHEARVIGEKTGDTNLRFMVELARGRLEQGQARLKLAKASFARGLALARVSGGEELPSASAAHFSLGLVAYQQNDLDSAIAHTLLGIEQSNAWWVRDELIKAYGTLASAYRARSETRAMDDALQKADGLSVGNYVGYFVGQVGLMPLREWLEQGKLPSVDRWIENSSLEQLVRAAADTGTEKFNATDQVMLHMRVRLLAAQGEFAQARPFLARWVEWMQGRDWNWWLIPVAVLQALVEHALGDTVCAQSALAHALTLAEPEGVVRPFLDEGEELRAMISDLQGRLDDYISDKSAVQRMQAFCTSLLAMFSGMRSSSPAGAKSEIIHPPSKILIEPLTKRELEILQLAAEGLSNREIADKLYLSIGTVKVHLKHIFGKLDVSSRTQASARARELNLL